MAADLTLDAATATTQVMSCDATVIVTGGDGVLAQRAVQRLHDLESLWSRFVSTSEISRLNRAAGRPCRVSPETSRLVVALVQAWHVTDGAFDPTLLGTLVELGYAASRDDATVRTSLADDASVRGRPDLVLVDEAGAVVQLPAGTTLDPGGLGKGLAADIVVAELRESGAPGALVEIGGDLRADGTPPEGDAWAVAIRPGLRGADRRVVDLRGGGVATSSSRLRTWTSGGRELHHLIDPATRTSSDRGVIACSVIARSAAWAEAFTKVAFTCEPADAVATLAGRGLAASITTESGDTVTTPAWDEFVR